jgi:PKD repeat protein
MVSVDGAGQSVVGVAYDAAGNSASATVGSINIDRTKPVVGSIVLPASIAPGVSFTASAEFTESNLDRAVWEWGDGTTANASVNGATASGTHTYSTAGTFTVKMTVTDKAGNTGSAAATAAVAAATSAPTATPTAVPTAPVSPTPVPAPSFLLISLALIGGAMLVATTRKK